MGCRTCFKPVQEAKPATAAEGSDEFRAAVSRALMMPPRYVALRGWQCDQCYDHETADMREAARYAAK